MGCPRRRLTYGQFLHTALRAVQRWNARGFNPIRASASLQFLSFSILELT
jgi:hypothetical protein